MSTSLVAASVSSTIAVQKEEMSASNGKHIAAPAPSTKSKSSEGRQRKRTGGVIELASAAVSDTLPGKEEAGDGDDIEDDDENDDDEDKQALAVVSVPIIEQKIPPSAKSVSNDSIPLNRKRRAASQDRYLVQSQFQVLIETYFLSESERKRDTSLTQFYGKQLVKLTSAKRVYTSDDLNGIHKSLQTRSSLAVVSTRSSEAQKHAWMQLTSFQEQYSTNEEALFAAKIFKWHNFHGFPNDAPTSHKRITSFFIAALYLFFPMWENSPRQEGSNLFLESILYGLYNHANHATNDDYKLSRDDLSSYLSVLYREFFYQRGTTAEYPLQSILISFLTIMWGNEKNRDENVSLIQGNVPENGETELNSFVCRDFSGVTVFKEEFSVKGKTYEAVSMITIKNDVIDSYVKQKGEIIHASDGETRLTAAFPTNPSLVLYMEKAKVQDGEEGGGSSS